jgi:CRISPR/Cas system CMR subunit Cmr6 (Cas7 group RAMP superfamily)
MRTIILAASLLLASQAHAQVQVSKRVLCAETTQVLEAFQGNKYKEVLRWSGRDLQNENNTYVLLTNTKTKTFTLIEMNTEMACVLGTGTASSFHSAEDHGDKL